MRSTPSSAPRWARSASPAWRRRRAQGRDRQGARLRPGQRRARRAGHRRDDLSVRVARQAVHCGGGDASGRRRKDRAERSAHEIFPRRPPAWRAITVRHLLTHTSGIPDYTDGLVDYRRDYSEDELVKFAQTLRARLSSRRAVEIQQHGLRAARRHRAQGVGQVLRRRAARARVRAARHEDGARDQRARHRATSRRRLSPRAGHAAESDVGVAGAQHDR